MAWEHQVDVLWHFFPNWWLVNYHNITFLSDQGIGVELLFSLWLSLTPTRLIEPKIPIQIVYCTAEAVLIFLITINIVLMIHIKNKLAPVVLQLVSKRSPPINDNQRPVTWPLQILQMTSWIDPICITDESKTAYQFFKGVSDFYLSPFFRLKMQVSNIKTVAIIPIYLWTIEIWNHECGVHYEKSYEPDAHGVMNNLSQKWLILFGSEAPQWRDR